MTVHTFPALGFDPAPGEPDALTSLARECGSLGVDLGEDATRLRRLADGDLWQGDAARAFRRRLHDLPHDLDVAGDAYVLAAGALQRFARELAEAQLRARDLERRADLLSSRGDRVDAGDRIDQVLREAAELQGEVRTAAGACGRVLAEACRHAPHPPGWFSQLLDEGARLVGEVNKAVGDFVRAHAETIGLFADVLSKVSSALALVAMLAGPIPVLGTAVASLAGTGALLAAGVALLGHTALAAYTGASWTPVVMDALGVVAGVGPRGVEAAAGRLASARGLELGETSMTTQQAVGALRHPAQSWAEAAEQTMTFPTLVTKTISYQFDLVGGAVGIVDLSELVEPDEEAADAPAGELQTAGV